MELQCASLVLMLVECWLKKFLFELPFFPWKDKQKLVNRVMIIKASLADPTTSSR